MITFHVPGKPAPQGSKRWLPNGQMKEASDDLPSWRAAVTYAAMQAMRSSGLTFPILGPVEVTMTFTFTRPKSHYGTGKNAGVLKSSAPLFYSNQPDWDKLARAVNDAITDAGLWKDDAQAALGSVVKLYDTVAGVTVGIKKIEQTEQGEK